MKNEYGKYSGYTSEELKFNLPDYVSGKIINKDLIDAIEKELADNPEFKKEADELRGTFTFLEKAEFENPPELYFTNLSVKINDRLQNSAGIIKEKQLSFFDKYIFNKKILIPLIPVLIILIFFLLKNKNEDKDINLTLTKDTTGIIVSEKTKKESVSDSLIKEITPDRKVNTEAENSLKTNGITKSVFTEGSKKNNFIIQRSDEPAEKPEKDEVNFTEKKAATLFPENLLSDNIDDAEINEDIYDAEDVIDNLLQPDSFEEGSQDYEIPQLTPQEEKELLDNLRKSKI